MRKYFDNDYCCRLQYFCFCRIFVGGGKQRNSGGDGIRSSMNKHRAVLLSYDHPQVLGEGGQTACQSKSEHVDSSRRQSSRPAAIRLMKENNHLSKLPTPDINTHHIQTHIVSEALQSTASMFQRLFCWCCALRGK